MEQRFVLTDELKEKIEKIIGGKYDYKLGIEDIESIIEELVYQYNNLQHEFDDYKDMVYENYKPISKHEEFDVNERDFH